MKAIIASDNLIFAIKCGNDEKLKLKMLKYLEIALYYSLNILVKPSIYRDGVIRFIWSTRCRLKGIVYSGLK